MLVKNEIDLLTAVQHGDLKIVKKLARAKDVNKAILQDELENPILYLAIKQIKLKDATKQKKEAAIGIAKELIKSGYPVHTANRHGYTPLHKAVKKSQLEIVDLLLEPEFRV